MLTTIGARALSLIVKVLIWQSTCIPNLPNHQIKSLTKVSCYTVCTVWASLKAFCAEIWHYFPAMVISESALFAIVQNPLSALQLQ